MFMVGKESREEETEEKLADQGAGILSGNNVTTDIFTFISI